MPTTFQLIASNTIVGSLTSVVTFSSIPNTFTDLVVRIAARDTTNGDQGTLQVIYNGSGTAVYSYVSIVGTGSAVSTGQTSANPWYFTYANGATTTADIFSNSEIYIPNYLVSQNKVGQIQHTYENNATAARTVFSGNLWRNTSAISSITITSSNIYVAGSSFYLYGIKNS